MAGKNLKGTKSFDNLKDGAPAIVKATSPAPVPATAPTSGKTQAAAS